MKFILLSIVIFTNIFADLKTCTYYAEKSIKLQNEVLLYIENNLTEDACFASKDALRNTIKAKVECKGTSIEEKMDDSIKNIKYFADKCK